MRFVTERYYLQQHKQKPARDTLYLKLCPRYLVYKSRSYHKSKRICCWYFRHKEKCLVNKQQKY